MLEYVKMILQKVSFDRQLFEKELKKSRVYLLKDELKEFRSWCYESFGAVYRAVLDQFFSTYPNLT